MNTDFGITRIWVQIPASPLTRCSFPLSFSFLFLFLSQRITVIVKWNNIMPGNQQLPVHLHHSFPSTMGYFSHWEAVGSENCRGSKMLTCSTCCYPEPPWWVSCMLMSFLLLECALPRVCILISRDHFLPLCPLTFLKGPFLALDLARS